MLVNHFRRDSVVKLICFVALAVQGLTFGWTSEYFDTFVFYPALTGIFGFVLGRYPLRDHEAVEREADRVAPEFLPKMLAPLTLSSLAITTFVLFYDMYAGSFTRFEWWPIVLSLLCGTSIGNLVRLSKR